MDAKKFILNTLDYLKYQVENNLCTMEEIESVLDMLYKTLNVVGTVEDFAKYYGQKEANVRNVLSRKVLAKPKRRVFYKFLPFLKNVPDKWLKNK